MKNRKRPAETKENNGQAVSTVPKIEATAELTAYSEAAPTIVDKDVQVEHALDVIANPFEEQDIKQVLSRSYPVGEFDWAPSDVHGTNIAKLEFPSLLYGIFNIQDKLTTFEWLRSNVDLSVKISATDMHMGALNISALTHCKDPASMGTPAQRLAAEQSYPIYCGSVNSVDFTLSRTGPRMFDQTQVEEVVGSEIGTVWIDVLDPLELASGETPPTMKVTVFANFNDPRVAGYGATPVSAVRLAALNKRFVHQRAEKHSSKGKVARAATVTKVEQEAKAKSSGGIISGIAEAAGNFAPVLAATPFAEFAPFAALAGVAAPFLRSLGLCKPMNLASIQPTSVEPWRDLVNTHGLSQAVKMTAHPEASVGDTDLCGLKRNTILDVIMTPTLICHTKIDSLVAANEPFMAIPISPGLSRKIDSTHFLPSHMAYLSQWFNRWRGSVLLHFKFNTSRYTSARVRITIFPSGSYDSDILATAGDSYSEVVDVRGLTEKDIPVPYASPWATLPVPGFYSVNPGVDLSQAMKYGNQIPWVVLSLVNEVQPGFAGGNTNIYCNVWASAGPDMTFGDFTGYNLQNPAIPVLPDGKKLRDVPKKHSMKEHFKRPFKPFLPMKVTTETGLVMPEKFTTIEELAHRYETMQQTGFPAGSAIDATLSCNDFTPIYTLGTDKQSFLDGMAAIFRYYRGGLRFKLGYLNATDDQQTLGYFARTQSLDWVNPNTTVFLVSSKSPTFDMEIPHTFWSYAVPLDDDFPEDAPTDYGWINVVQLPVGSGYVQVYRAVGEDFTFGVLTPPPVYNFVVPTEAKKSKLGESSKEELPTKKTISANGLLTVSEIDSYLAPNEAPNAALKKGGGWDAFHQKR